MEVVPQHPKGHKFLIPPQSVRVSEWWTTSCSILHVRWVAGVFSWYNSWMSMFDLFQQCLCNFGQKLSQKGLLYMWDHGVLHSLVDRAGCGRSAAHSARQLNLATQCSRALLCWQHDGKWKGHLDPELWIWGQSLSLGRLRQSSQVVGADGRKDEQSVGGQSVRLQGIGSPHLWQ